MIAALTVAGNTGVLDKLPHVARGKTKGAAAVAILVSGLLVAGILAVSLVAILLVAVLLLAAGFVMIIMTFMTLVMVIMAAASTFFLCFLFAAE